MGCTASRPAAAAVAPLDQHQPAPPASLSPPRMRKRSGLAFRFSSESVRGEEKAEKEEDEEEEEKVEAKAPGEQEKIGGAEEEREPPLPLPSSSPLPPMEGPFAYRLGRTLGSGGFSVVREAVRLRDGARFAAKVIPMPPPSGDEDGPPCPLPSASPPSPEKKAKEKGAKDAREALPPPSTRAEVEREVACLRALPPHPNVVRLVDAFDDGAQSAFVVVTELLSGGELLDALLAQDGGAYPEATAALAAAQVAAALAHAHSHGVVHRDVKLDNVLLAESGDLGSLKLADFGLSAALAPSVGPLPGGNGGNGGDADTETETEEQPQRQPQQPLFGLATVCGTPAYVAPEVLAAGRGGPRYGAEADCWSLGVLIFTLLGGYQPFWAESEAELFGLIRRGQYDGFEDEVWAGVSGGAKDLVASLLVVDPSARLSAAGALGHPWLAAAVAAGALAPGALPPAASPARLEEAKEAEEGGGRREPLLSPFAAAAATAATASRSLSPALSSLQPRASSSGDSSSNSNALALRRAASLARQARNARGGKNGGGPAAATAAAATTQALQARQLSSPLPPPHPRRRPSVPLPQPPVSAFAQAAGQQQKQQQRDEKRQQVKVGASSADAE